MAFKKTQKRLASILFLALFITLCPIKEAKADQTFLSDWIQTVYANDENIPVSRANHILQTRDGYIWIGGYEGLLRYDGKKSKVFTETEDGFPSTQINTLYEAKNGDLWIGTNDEGLVLYKEGAFTRFDRNQGMPSDSICSIAEDSAGNVYMATSYGIVLLTPEYNLHLITNQRENPIHATDITVTNKDELWCVSKDGTVYVMNMEKVIKTYEPGHFNGYGVTSVFCSSGNDVYLGTDQNQVVRVRDDGFQTIGLETKVGVNHLYEDGYGRIWVLTETGMGYLEDEEFHSVDGALIENHLLNMIEDYEGNYWIASSDMGILHLVRSKFKNLNFALSLPERKVNVTYRFGGDLYIGTEEGLLILNGKGERVENDLSQVLRGVSVKDIIASKNGNLWMCTDSEYGLVRYNKDGTLAYLTEKDGLPSNKVRRVMVTSDDQVIASTAEGVSVIKDYKVNKNYTPENGLMNTNILSFSEDKDGIVYFSTDGSGILLLDPKKDEITRLTRDDGLLSDVVVRLRYDKYKDGIWIACSKGLCYLDKDGIRPVDKLNGFDFNILDIKIIDSDAIWFVTAGEVWMASKYNLLSDEPLQVSRLDDHDGLSSPVTQNARSQLDKDGILYLACAKGVWSIDTANPYRNDTAPKIAVNHVKVDDKVYTGLNNIVVPSDAKRVTIDYALLTYSSPSNNRVGYYLDGAGEGKVEADLDEGTSVSYTNLKGGNYRFIISGTNKEGIVSETLELTMQKKQGLLETYQFKLAVLLVLAASCVGAGMLIAKGRTRLLANKNRRYKETIGRLVAAMGDVIDDNVGNVGGRSRRMANCALEVGKRLGLSKRERETLFYDALLYGRSKMKSEGEVARAMEELAEELGIGKRNVPEEDALLQRIVEMVDYYEARMAEYAAGEDGGIEEALEKIRKDSLKRFDYELVDAMMDVALYYYPLQHGGINES